MSSFRREFFKEKNPMNFMEKWFVCLLVFVFVFGGVFAAEDDWGDVSAGNESDVVQAEEEIVEDYVAPAPYEGVSEETGDGKFFTLEFYIALFLVVLVLGAVGYVVWLFLRGPRNKWEK